MEQRFSDNVNWYGFKNIGPDPIPSYAVVMIEPYTESDNVFFAGKKPADFSEPKQFAINGNSVVAPNQFGYITLEGPAIALGDPFSPPIGSASTELVMPVENQWYLRRATVGATMTVRYIALAGTASRLIVKRRELGVDTAFFDTADFGIPAAQGRQTPGSATLEKLKFDGSTINSLESPVFETVYNHTLSAVAPDKIIQAKTINGYWFIDVEPCESDEDNPNPEDPISGFTGDATSGTGTTPTPAPTGYS